MKYAILSSVLITVLLYGQFMEANFPHILNIILLAIIFILLFLEKYFLIGKNYVADFKIRSHGKRPSNFQILITLFWTALYFFDDNSTHLLFIVLLFWSQTIIDIVINFVYKAKKPFTIFIKDEELILNNIWKQKRNLTDITEIEYDRFSKRMILNFKSKWKVSINTDEYEPHDMESFLEIMIEKSEYDIGIPQNFKPKLKQTANNIVEETL